MLLLNCSQEESTSSKIWPHLVIPDIYRSLRFFGAFVSQGPRMGAVAARGPQAGGRKPCFRMKCGWAQDHDSGANCSWMGF